MLFLEYFQKELREPIRSDLLKLCSFNRGFLLGVVHILRNQPRGGSKCLRLIIMGWGGGGGGGGREGCLVVDYVIKIFIFYQFS